MYAECFSIRASQNALRGLGMEIGVSSKGGGGRDVSIEIPEIAGRFGSIIMS